MEYIGRTKHDGDSAGERRFFTRIRQAFRPPITGIGATACPLGFGMMLLAKLLLLLLVANGAPVLLEKLLGRRYARPVDHGRTWRDGRPFFGPSKTWRGVIGATLCTPAAAVLLGLPAAEGVLIAMAAMAGDLLSSFAKRRLAIAPSGMALGLDQIPEALLPLLLLAPPHELGLIDVAVTVGAFVAAELMLSRLLYRLHIRKQPY